jgi:hypothetical protein
MQNWLIATLEGICLGLTLYLCVRLRMYLGPVIRERFGDSARQVYWLLTILLMVILANAGLYLFRIYLSSQPVADGTFMLELWFALMALAVGLWLIYKRLTRHSRNTDDPGANAD